jgi:thioredoxin 1
MGEPANLIHFKGSSDELKALVKANNGLVVLDFFADWCGPCQNLGRQLPGIAGQSPNVKFVKINTEENKDVAAEFKVRSIPHIAFVKGVSANDTIEPLEVINGANVSAIKAAIQKHQ